MTAKIYIILYVPKKNSKCFTRPTGMILFGMKLNILTKRGCLILQTASFHKHSFPIFYFFSLMAACAAARRAIGTRKGEQLT
jgi:hypothetical protein